MIAMPSTPRPSDSPPQPSLARRFDRLDREWSKWIATELPRPRWVRLPLGVLSRTANYGILWYGLAALPLILGEPRPLVRALYVVVPVTLVEATGFLVKRVVARPRPPIADSTLLVQIPLPLSKSFPSSHASMSIVGALTMAAMYPAALPFLGALAVLLCFSRVYLGVHYFGDVVAGIAYGLAWGAAWLIFIPLP